MELKKYKYISDYFDGVEDGTIIVCEEQKLLIDYLKTRVFNRDDIYFDEQAVEDSIKVPAIYFPFKLFTWQKFAQCFLYGLRWKETGELVFNTYFVYVGRGSGKNGWIAWNSFYMLSKKHGIANYDIDLYATSESQAKTSFQDVHTVIDNPKNKGLKSVGNKKGAFTITKELIQSTATKSCLRFNTSNARTKDGKRPGMNVFDEIHEYEDYKAISVATSGGGKVKDYREFYITTDGRVRNGPLDDLKEESRAILHGELGVDKEGAEFSSLFPFIFKLDRPEEVDDFNCWQKASPSVNENRSLKNKMLQEYAKMQRNASLRIEFMTKRMNSPMEDTRFQVASYDDLLHTQEEPFPDGPLEAVGGLDFADVRDFCSVGFLSRYEGKVFWKQHTFIHDKALQLQDINQDIVDIALQKGLAEMVHGDSISPKKIVAWFVEQRKDHYIETISMDMFRSIVLKPLLEEAGFKVNIVRSGNVTHSKLSPLIDELFIEKKLFFGDDPLMRWYVNNVYVDYLANGNKEFKKINPERRKTDGFFAFIHALNMYPMMYDNTNISLEDFTFKPIIV